MKKSANNITTRVPSAPKESLTKVPDVATIKNLDRRAGRQSQERFDEEVTRP
jgi:hypothetical protein